MLKTKILVGLFLIIGAFSSCRKDVVSADEQAKIDEQLIVDFVAKNNIPAIKDPSGLYYQIITAGSENTTINNSSTITINYEGRLLNGNVFDKSSAPATFPLVKLIKGWQIGIPLIQKGGKIRLLIPSALAYGSRAPGNGIKANEVLDFTIELIDAK